MTDLGGLPHEVRYSMTLLRIADRWKKFPDEVEERSQEIHGHLEYEQMVHEALKRYS